MTYTTKKDGNTLEIVVTGRLDTVSAPDLEKALMPLPEGVNTDYGMENASFVRVRNITLGYNFSSKVLQRMGNVFTGLKIYFDAQNPLTFMSPATMISFPE